MKENFIKMMQEFIKGMQEPLKKDAENIENDYLKKLASKFMDIVEEMQRTFKAFENGNFEKEDKSIFTIVASIFTQNLNDCVHEYMKRDTRSDNE